MKKILVVLLILAVAGGVFAQGSWSINGKVELGATMDFYELTTDTENPTFYAFDYKSKDDDDGVNRAALGLSYGRDGFNAGIDYTTVNKIVTSMTYYGDRFSLGAQGHLNQLLTGNFKASVDNDLKAWGTYSMLDGIVDLGVYVKKWIADPWLSDLSIKVFNYDTDKYDIQGDVWGNFCCRSGIMTNFNFSGITFGAMLRSTKDGANQFFWNPDKDAALDLIDDVLSKLIIGMKFDLHPITVAAQFNLEKLGAYLGLTWGFTDTISAGLSFIGVLKEDSDTIPVDTAAIFGASLNYTTDAFGVTIKGGYQHDGQTKEDRPDTYTGTVAIAPGIWFNAIPSHLQVKLDTKFEFDDVGFGWEFIPGVTWNFKGTGAGDWATGIGLHYTIAKDKAETDVTKNEANITFCWNF